MTTGNELAGYEQNYETGNEVNRTTGSELNRVTGNEVNRTTGSERKRVTGNEPVHSIGGIDFQELDTILNDLASNVASSGKKERLE